jgi:AcrR family transcriptional regulator
VGAETSKTRGVLLDGAEQLMLSDGYAAVTYRAVAAKAGVTAGLVQYYFPTLDDLFVAMLRRRSDRNLERLVNGLRDHPDEPLRVIWEFNRDETTSALLMEFLALANHRKTIRAEIAEVTRRSRQVQLEALATKSSAYLVPNAEIAPDVLLFFLATIPKMLLMEEDVGLSTDPHAQVLDLVNRYIEGVEKPKAPKPARTLRTATRSAPKKTASRSARRAASD